MLNNVLLHSSHKSLLFLCVWSLYKFQKQVKMHAGVVRAETIGHLQLFICRSWNLFKMAMLSVDTLMMLMVSKKDSKALCGPF